MKRRKAPGELEMLILKKLQELNEASVHDLLKALNNQYAYTTVLTVLRRMHLKKILARRKSQKQYIYYLPSTHKKNSLIEKLKKSLFEGKTSQMVHYLIETSEPISEEELQKLEALIASYKK